MSNEFSKEEKVAWADMCAGFEDACTLSTKVDTYPINGESMERSNDTIWRPMPYIMQSFDGMDQTANFVDNTQMSVPASLSIKKSSPWYLDALQLRDSQRAIDMAKAGLQILSSNINTAVLNVAALQGSLVVKRTTAAAGFDDVALCEAVMNEQGVPMMDRYLALSTRDYNGMASNLSVASRSFGNQKSDKAYEDGYVGRVSSFETYKLDVSRSLTAAAGGGAKTIDTQAAAVNYYTPRATSTAVTGEVSNVDNRFQTITVSSTANVAAGDAFTIAGVYAVHHITKQSTGQLKTFRVYSVTDGTHMVITPPIISAQGSTDAELQYQNCTVTPSANAAIVFLNTTTAAANPFWYKGSIELLPGGYVVPSDAGVAVLKYTTKQGVAVTMTKQYDINNMKTKFRVDTFFGVVNKNPEMNGIILFGQA